MKQESGETSDVILIGAGGHALSLAEFSGHRICGYIANEANDKFSALWFGNDSVAKEVVSQDKPLHIAFIYSGLPVMSARRKIIEYYDSLGASYASLISPVAIVTANSVVGVGCAVMSGAIVNRASLGAHVVVNSGAIVEHDCSIGNNTFIGPGAVIGGFTNIGSNCFIGLGARVSNGITIGDNITVAMGAIVTKNLTKPGIYHGYPLRHYPYVDQL